MPTDDEPPRTSSDWPGFSELYEAWSRTAIPRIGKAVAKDEASYRYLAESIRMHPDQETLAGMMREVGLGRVEYFNMSAGVVALHRGFKL